MGSIKFYLRMLFFSFGKNMRYLDHFVDRTMKDNIKQEHHSFSLKIKHEKLDCTINIRNLQMKQNARKKQRFLSILFTAQNCQ